MSCPHGPSVVEADPDCPWCDNESIRAAHDILRADLASERELSEGLMKAVAKAETERDALRSKLEAAEYQAKRWQDEFCRLVEIRDAAQGERDVLAKASREVEEARDVLFERLRKAANQRDDALTRAERAEADAAAMLDTLRAMEWSASAAATGGYCPRCLGHDEGDGPSPGHKEECDLWCLIRPGSSFSAAGSALLARMERYEKALKETAALLERDREYVGADYPNGPSGYTRIARDTVSAALDDQAQEQAEGEGT